MKRILSGILAFILLLGLAGCGHEPEHSESETANTGISTMETEAAEVTEPVVPAPMERPVYSFDHTPTTDELRQMAVKAMHDELTVQFGVSRFYRYTKRERVGEKFFTYVPQNVYCGLPYTDASMSLIQWFEYYDPETGLLHFDQDGQMFDSMLGNSCANSVCAAIATVSPSIRGFFTTEMTPYYGFIPVGSYVIPAAATNYHNYSTGLITELNGPEVMYASYAMMLPGDGLVSIPDNHAMMCIEPARVVYRANGEIDPTKSVIVIQDQRGGYGKGYYTETVDGQDYHYSGRTYYEYTFSELFSLSYIPLTTPEFLGLKEYTEPSISFDRPDCSLDEVVAGVVTSPYPIYVGRMILIDENGNETTVDKTVLDNRATGNSSLRRFMISQIKTSPNSDAFRSMLEAGKTYTLRYEVVLSNGSTHTVIEFDVTG